MIFTNASDARKLALQKQTTEYAETISKIREQASKGEFVLYLYNSPLRQNTVDELRKNGFEVIDCPSVTIQKDSLYHIIKW